MADFANGAIEVFAGPTDLGGPDDLEGAICSFIDGAKDSLDIAVQELDSERIAQAILDARWRGVRVRMFLEQDYLLAKKVPEAVPGAGETPEAARRRVQWDEDDGLAANRSIMAALLRSNVDVRADFNPDIFHQKFVIRDHRGAARPTSALLTGSTNFTVTDTHSNLNHVVVFHDARICKQYVREFDEIRSGSFGRRQHGPEPKVYNLGGVPVKVLFAPDHTPELEVVKQMLKCRDRLDFAIFTFAGSSGIDDAMIMLKHAGRTIRGALDPGQGRQWWAATEWLHDEGIQVVFPKRTGGLRKLHHKLMLIDDATVVAGSMNYTAPANAFNDENIFVIGSPHELPAKEGGPVDHAECARIVGYLRDEVDRIIAASESVRFRRRPVPVDG